ncbi:hypothetical protein BDK51DRAFT_47709 [Blyttiomyces helicus]|uniref:Uncharacterized protein n=1 Tax=Blyttiomyces helicus TaxID=388810 RepID=A0A4P9W1X9_9FUNG|nr:hypothetical protein BDK51DRAFT_47709 [Blyttiomyces helicus]|eukprot:RKO85702.1 hypothetical protein BDK51DRAFT_47709 [Blyttiomyces helicus]
MYGSVPNLSAPPSRGGSLSRLPRPGAGNRTPKVSIERLSPASPTIKNRRPSRPGLTVSQSLENMASAAAVSPDADPERDLMLASAIGQQLLARNKELQDSLAVANAARDRAEEQRDEARREADESKRKALEAAEEKNLALAEVHSLEAASGRLKTQIKMHEMKGEDAESLKEQISHLQSTNEQLERSLEATKKKLKDVTAERASLWSSVQGLHEQLAHFAEINKNLKASYQEQIEEYDQIVKKLQVNIGNAGHCD